MITQLETQKLVRGKNQEGIKIQNIIHQQIDSQLSPTRKRPNHIKLMRQNSYAPFCQSNFESLIDIDQSSTALKTQKFKQLAKAFALPQLNTKGFKQSFKQIMHSFNSLDSFTENMQKKVDLLLKQQENEFVQSYTQHMKKIKNQFSEIQRRIQVYEQKIKYYQNEGKMSHLVIKVSKLEQQCKNLYSVIQNKQKQIKQKDLSIKVVKSELKRLQKEMKLLLREKNQSKLNKQIQQQQSIKFINHKKFKSSQEQFKEQILGKESPNELDNSNIILSKNTTTLNLLDQISQMKSNSNKKVVHMFNNTTIKNDISQKSITCDISLGSAKQISNNERSIVNKQMNNQQKIESKYKKQILLLKKKNQMLNSFQSHVLNQKTSLQDFFLRCVNQIKQQIFYRNKKTSTSNKTYCSFQDFKNQDKIQLMIKVISNEQITQYLYDRLFNKKNDLFTINPKNQDLKQKKIPKSISKTYKHVSLYKETERPNCLKDKSQIYESKDMGLLKNGNYHNVLPKLQFNLQY